jgi:predicted transcriptional regulator
MKWERNGTQHLRILFGKGKIEVMAEPLQIELESAKIVALDALAAHSGKRREDLVAQAVEDLLALEQHNLDAIREGWADVEAGRVIAHEEIIPLIRSLRTRM